MHDHAYVERVVDLLDPTANIFLNTTAEAAEEALGSGDPERVRAIDGQFAIAQRAGRTVRMARSIGRPMRYFLAKRKEGPCLVIAERIDEIQRFLEEEHLDDQFHPSYTRMVPSHHVVELELVGCPDPSPSYARFFTPERNTHGADVEAIGEAYIRALERACAAWLDSIPPHAPVGVLFSGGIDSGSVFLILYHLLLQRGVSPARLKAFTLSVRGGTDTEQAFAFLDALDLSLFLEVVEAVPEDVDFREAVRVIEDYKPLDVQAAAVTAALCKGIRARYPDWRYLVDGDGGDENLKDYPIEENPELTIRSVLSNLMLYQEGWGVDAVKHSLTYSGGQSRGHVRSYAPVRTHGFTGFSPYALPNVIEIAEGIPFVELTGWDHERLYALKGKVVRSGVRAVTGFDMPTFEKRRFQHGAVGKGLFEELFPDREIEYRRTFASIFT
jgi:asparagine synthase (glutamine-hydrolysing)